MPDNIKWFRGARFILALFLYRNTMAKPYDSYWRYRQFQHEIMVVRLLGAVDSILVLEKEARTENKARLYITGRRVRDQVLRLEFEENTNVWRLVEYVTNLQSPLDKLFKGIQHVIPSMMSASCFLITPLSWTLNTIASMNTMEYTADSGRFCTPKYAKLNRR